jgi:hypothetical protein
MYMKGGCYGYIASHPPIPRELRGEAGGGTIDPPQPPSKKAGARRSTIYIYNDIDIRIIHETMQKISDAVHVLKLTQTSPPPSSPLSLFSAARIAGSP